MIRKMNNYLRIPHTADIENVLEAEEHESSNKDSEKETSVLKTLDISQESESLSTQPKKKRRKFAAVSQAATFSEKQKQ